MHFSKDHLEAVYKILRYLKNLLERGLLFSKIGERKIEVLFNVDLARLVKDKRSTTGYCTFIWGNNLVTCRSKKHNLEQLSKKFVNDCG